MYQTFGFFKLAITIVHTGPPIMQWLILCIVISQGKIGYLTQQSSESHTVRQNFVILMLFLVNQCIFIFQDSYAEARERLNDAAVETDFSASENENRRKQYGRGHRISKPPRTFSPSPVRVNPSAVDVRVDAESSSDESDSAANMLSTGLQGISPPAFNPPISKSNEIGCRYLICYLYFGYIEGQENPMGSPVYEGQRFISIPSDGKAIVDFFKYFKNVNCLLIFYFSWKFIISNFEQ